MRWAFAHSQRMLRALAIHMQNSVKPMSIPLKWLDGIILCWNNFSFVLLNLLQSSETLFQIMSDLTPIRKGILQKQNSKVLTTYFISTH